MAHMHGAGEHWESAYCSGRDFGEDPLLPQKALPLPDDSDVSAALQSEPADVVAAAASAMAACDALPDGAAESLMQPLAEAYLLAVRREAELLPKVVSAVSARSKMRTQLRSGTSASSDAFCTSKAVGICASKATASVDAVRSRNSSFSECKGQTPVEESSIAVLTENAAAYSTAKTNRPAKENFKNKAAPNCSEVSSVVEAGEKASSCTCASAASSSEDDSSDDEVENPRQSEGSLAEFLDNFRSSERTRKETEAGVKCAAEFAVESAEQQLELRSECTGVHGDREAAGHTAARESCAQQTGPGESVCQTIAEPFSCAVEKSVVVDTPTQDGSAGGDSRRDASHLGAAGCAPSRETNAEKAAVSMEAPATAVGSNTVYPRVQRIPTETEKAAKDTRQKVAAYVDRLVLLDKQREAASASASAPAPAWRAAALQQFKGLRSYVSSSEFFLQEHQQPAVAADCLSWSEQEWQLYCRCYPPSLGLLGMCDTVTLCRILFLLVEDVKQQQRAIAKTERKPSGGTSSSSCACLAGGSQTWQDEASTKADKEQSSFASREPVQQQSRTTEAEQLEGQHASSFRVNGSPQGRGAERDQDDYRKLLHLKKQEDFMATNHLPSSAESGRAYSTHGEDDKDGMGPAWEITLLKDTDDSSSGVHEGKEEDADEIATETNISCAAGCTCCRHRGCCVTLQQACWLFGVFVFLDELQAMDADVASCIQQLRRLCENARERATGHCEAVQQQLPTGRCADEAAEKALESPVEGALPLGGGKRIATWVPTDLVAALNLLIVVINDFFNQR